MGSNQQLSEVEGEPLAESNLILHDHVQEAVQKYPNEPAVISCWQSQRDIFGGDKSTTDGTRLQWSYSELWRYAGTLSQALLREGYNVDRPLAVFLRSQAEWPLAVWTALRLNATFVPMHPKILDSPLELQHELKVINPGVILVADSETAQKLTALEAAQVQNAKVKIYSGIDNGTIADGGWSNLSKLMTCDEKAPITLPNPVRTQDDVSLFFFTGGTTSLPKPAPNKNSINVLVSGHIKRLNHLGPGRRLAAHLPSFHSFGAITNIGYWIAGGCVVFPASSFSPSTTLDAIEKERCTDMPGNPSMVDSLVRHPMAASMDLSSLTQITLGGSLVHPEVIRKCQAPPLGAKYVRAGYGMSEAGIATLADLYQPPVIEDGAASIGTVANGVKLRICHPGTRDPVPWGEIGELHIGDPFIYKGYPGRDESWLYSEGRYNFVISGDQARFGEKGNLFILGRYKDLIIRGGANISPAAIENVLNVLPGLEALVVGLADDIAGEVPVAVVKFSGDRTLSDKEIRSTVISSLGKNCAPQKIITLQQLGLKEFPLTAASKLDRKKAAALVAEFCAQDQDDGAGEVEHQNGDFQSTPDSDVAHLQRIVAGVWAQLSAQDPSEISSISDFADSLLMLQATSLIERRTKRPITLEEIMANPTIEQQAQLLSRRATRQNDAGTGKTATRDGPPLAADLVHVKDALEYDRTVQLAQKKLSPFGLGWSDVEDVLPCYDFAHFMLTSAPRRDKSWCFRFTYTSKVSREELRHGISETLRDHAILRSVPLRFDNEGDAAVKRQRYDDGTWLFLIPRHSQQWIDRIINVSNDTVAESDLPDYQLNDVELDHASLAGPVLRASICGVKDGSSAVVFNINHCAYDALSMTMFFDDLNLRLAGMTNEIPARVPYNSWANAYHLGRKGAAASKDSDYYVKKMSRSGVAKAPNARLSQWPPQKVPGWHWGSLSGWLDGNENHIDPSKRVYIDAENERIAHEGLEIDIPVKENFSSKAEAVTIVAVFKAAVAMFNVHKTQSPYALFSQWEAGRSWPFLEDNAAYQAMLPNAMDIKGPTCQLVPDIIGVSPQQTVISLLREVQEGISGSRPFVHAPLQAVIRALANNKDSATPEEDAQIAYDTLQRQTFDWVPLLSATDSMTEKPLKSIQALPHGDVGFLWLPARIDRDTVRMTVRWDAAQLDLKEAKSAMEEVAACAAWLMEESNWEKDVDAWWSTRHGEPPGGKKYLGM